MKKRQYRKPNPDDMIPRELPPVCCVISPEQNERLTDARRTLERHLYFLEGRGDHNFIGVHAPDLELLLRATIRAIPTLEDAKNQVGILVISGRPAADTRH